MALCVYSSEGDTRQFIAVPFLLQSGSQLVPCRVDQLEPSSPGKPLGVHPGHLSQLAEACGLQNSLAHMTLTTDHTRSKEALLGPTHRSQGGELSPGIPMVSSCFPGALSTAGSASDSETPLSFLCS